MARDIFFRYRDPDTTSRWNEMFRRIIRAGVYSGYTVSTGVSGGLWLKFTHDTDPDAPTSKLGIVYTRDGAVIHEDADQDDVVQGSVSGGTPNIHYVVASYTYNASRPPNDVAYAVRQGTSGSPPTPPTLGVDEVLLAEIYLPPGATAYTDAGVLINSVAKQDLYADTSDPAQELLGVLQPGIYSGMETVVGSSDLLVDLNAGTWITKQNVQVTESSIQADLFTLTDPVAGNYRFVWILGLHKQADTDPAPTADYITVEGSAVALGSAASLPTDAAIRTAVGTAYGAKYDDDADGLAELQYINKLGYIRVENRGGTYYKDYIVGESHLGRDSVRVYGAQAQSNYRSGQYYGHAGLVQAISDVYDLTKDRTDLSRVPYVIELDGDFKLADTTLHIPSHVLLKGVSAPTNILSESTYAVRMTGYAAEWNAVNATVSVTPGSPAVFAIQATYQVGDSLTTRMFSYGDLVYFWSEAQAKVYTGYVNEVTASWTFTATMEAQYATDGNPTDLDIIIKKRNCGVSNINVDGISAAAGGVQVTYVDAPRLSDVSCDNFYQTQVTNASYGSLVVRGTHAWGSGTLATFPSTAPVTLQSQYNAIDSMTVDGTAQTLFTNERDLRVGRLSLTSTGTVVAGTGINISALHGASTLQGTDVYVGYSSTTPTIIAANAATNKVAKLGSSATNRDAYETAEHVNQDRNIRLFSDAEISWNATTGSLSWTGHLYVDLPFTTGYNRIPSTESPATLGTDGDRLYCLLSRSATGTTDLTAGSSTLFIRPKASAASDVRNPNVFLLAVREGDTIYFSEGTRLDDLQTITLGSTPPPDGSVTYAKFAPDAVAFHNKFFRDYVSPASSGWVDDIVFKNSASATMVYTAATGVVAYTGTADFTAAKALLDAGVPLHLQCESGTTKRPEVLAIDVGAKEVTVAPGLSLTPGTGVWSGCIIRGSKAVTNDSLNSFTYSKTSGRITWSTGLSFKSSHVSVGMVFLDSAGTKHRIKAVDGSGSGNYVDLDPGLVNVDTTTPTSKHHGSIEIDNNPLGIEVNDLKASTGYEFVPIDYSSLVDLDTDFSDARLRVLFTSAAKGATVRAFGSPHDPRLRVYAEWSTPAWSEHGLPDGRIIAISFTGVFTRIFPVSDNETSVSVVSAVDIIDSFSDSLVVDVRSLHGVSQPIYAPRIKDTYLSYAPGVHTYTVWTTSSGEDNLGLRGLLVECDPGFRSSSPLTLISPGDLVMSGGVKSLESPYTLLPPTNPSSWDKGGRGIIQLPTSMVPEWTTSWVRSFSGTGDLTSSTALTNVSNPDDWGVGDLVHCVHLGVNYVRRIESILADTLTLDTSIGVSSAGVTIQYYGRDYYSTRVLSPRDTESVAYSVPITEFSHSQSGRTVSQPTATTTPAEIGWRLTDCSTGIVIQSGAGELTDGAFVFNVAAKGCRIYFTGTGISLGCAVAGDDMTLTLDGAVTLSPLTSSDNFTDPGGRFVVGELPYGQHILDINAGAGTFDTSIYSITVWQPKKPTVTGFELKDTCILGNSMYDDSVTVSAYTMNASQYGTVAVSAAQVLYGGAGYLDLDDTTAGVITANTTTQIAKFVSSAGSEYVAIPFVGNQITILYKSVLGGGNPINVTILDADGTYRAPSALTGFSALSSAGDTLPVHATYTKSRWVFSKYMSHVMILTTGNAGDEIYLDSFEYAPRFHSHITKVPTVNDRFMPFSYSGIDARNLVPFNTAQLPLMMHQATATDHMYNGTLASDYIQFVFYSAGRCDISLCLAYTNNAASPLGTFTVEIDGKAYYATSIFGDVSVSNDRRYMPVNFSVSLPEGLHTCVVQQPTDVILSSASTCSVHTYGPKPHSVQNTLISVGRLLG